MTGTAAIVNAANTSMNAAIKTTTAPDPWANPNPRRSIATRMSVAAKAMPTSGTHRRLGTTRWIMVTMTPTTQANASDRKAPASVTAPPGAVITAGTSNAAGAQRIVADAGSSVETLAAQTHMATISAVTPKVIQISVHADPRSNEVNGVRATDHCMAKAGNSIEVQARAIHHPRRWRCDSISRDMKIAMICTAMTAINGIGKPVRATNGVASTPSVASKAVTTSGNA